MESSTEAEYPPAFAFDIKIEQTAKGARVTVHARGNDKETTIDEAILIYKATAETLVKNGLSVAPIEEGKSK